MEEKVFPTLEQYANYMASLIETFGADARIKIKSPLGFNEEGAMIIDDDAPALMAGEGEDGVTEIYIMSAELQATFNDMGARSEEEGDEEEVKESSIINPTTGKGYVKGEKKKIII